MTTENIKQLQNILWYNHKGKGCDNDDIFDLFTHILEENKKLREENEAFKGTLYQTVLNKLNNAVTDTIIRIDNHRLREKIERIRQAVINLTFYKGVFSKLEVWKMSNDEICDKCEEHIKTMFLEELNKEE